ncbi:hypothetical protein CMK22_15645 [Candidatus Poribacteria bacterium]|nr:hypothetical protein [Candidatus Poribacteria bacterium]
MSQIEISNISFTYLGREEPTLNGISIAVEQGDFILLTGETSSGKSTLLKTINGLIPHTSRGKFQGNVRIDGLSVSDLTLSEIGRKVGLLFQSPDNQLFCTTVEDEIGFGLENMGMPLHSVDQAIDEALDLVRLEGFRQRETSTLSGGEKQLVALACLSAMQPEILLLDEPTSYLDVNFSRHVLQVISELNKKLEVTVIFATHQVQTIADFCNRSWSLRDGQVTEEKSVPKLQFKKTQVWERSVIHVQNRKNLLKMISSSFNCGGNTEIIDNVSLQVGYGEIVALMGQNGSGKTTLLMLMAKLLQPTSGEIILDDCEPKRNGESKIGFVFQNADLVLQAKTVEDEIKFGPLNFGMKCDLLEKRSNETADIFGISSYKNDHPYALSGGQRQRVAVAANVSLNPDLLLLDEPTTGQDMSYLNTTMQKLCHKVSNDNKTLIFSSHNVDLVLRYADRVLILNRGKLAFDDSINKFIDSHAGTFIK